MNVEALVQKFERIVFSMSDQELVEEFAGMGCDVKIAPPSGDGWTKIGCVTEDCQYSTRPSLTRTPVSSMSYAADSNELALAA